MFLTGVTCSSVSHFPLGQVSSPTGFGGTGILIVSFAHRCALVIMFVPCVMSRPIVVRKNRSLPSTERLNGLVKQKSDSSLVLVLSPFILKLVCIHALSNNALRM